MFPEREFNSTGFKVFMKNTEGCSVEVGMIDNLEVEKIESNKEVTNRHLNLFKEASFTLSKCIINKNYFYNLHARELRELGVKLLKKKRIRNKVIKRLINKF